MKLRSLTLLLTLLALDTNANTCDAPEASQVCSGQTVMGVSGSANCIQSAGAGSLANSSDICSSHYGFNNLAQVIQGTKDCSSGESILTNPNNNFSPSSINSLAAWYAADAISGVNSSLSNSEAVSGWIDISGNGRNFSTFTSGNAPTFVASQAQINSMPTVSFDGSDSLSYSINGKDILRNKSGASVVLVTKVNQTTSENVLLNITVGNSSVSRFFISRSFGTNGNIRFGGRRLDSNSFQEITSTTNYGTDYHILTLTIDYQNQQLQSFVDSTLDAQNNTFQTSGNTSDTNSTSVVLGQSANNDRYLNGEIAEILIFNEAISNDNQVAIECYLSEKYNISIAANCP